jgi:hypothetical protein
MKEGRNNKRFFGKKNHLSEWFSKMLEEDAVPNYNNLDFVPFLGAGGNSCKLYDTFNMFGGFPLDIALRQTPTASVSVSKFENSKLFNHMKTEICNGNPQTFEYLLNWVSHMIQKPAERPGTNILLHSPQGGGKDLLGNFISLLVGQSHSIKIGNIKDFLNKHNTEQQGKLFIRLNEISDRGEAFKNHNLLKGKTDEREIRIEPKGIDPYYVSNFARYIFFTNNLNALYIENSDRRYCMIKHSGEKCNDWKYFGPIWKELEDKELLLSAFKYFANRFIDDWKPGELPESRYRTQQKMAGLSSPYRFLTETLNGEFDVSALYEKNLKFSLGKSLLGSVPALYNGFKEWATQSGEKKPMKKQSFKEKLEALGLQYKIYAFKSVSSLTKKEKTTTIRGFRITNEDFENLMRKHTRDPNFKLTDSEAVEEIIESDSDSDSDSV